MKVGVAVEHRQGGYTLMPEATGAPITRLKSIENGERMRIPYWSDRNRWDDAGPLGGIILHLEITLEFIARDPVFWNWT